MHRFLSLLVAAIFTLISLPVGTSRIHADVGGSASGRHDQLHGRIQVKLEKLQEEMGFAGATVGCVLEDGTILRFAAGYSDVEKRTAMRPSDRMLAGSVGKTFVAAAVLELAQSGKLGLDDRIERWLGQEPWFHRLPNAKDITVRMLLNHTSGLPEHLKDEDFLAFLSKNSDKSWRPGERIAFILDDPPLSSAGGKHHYTDTNYIVLGLVVEKVTGSTYEEVLDSILSRLDLAGIESSNVRQLAGLVPGYTAGARSLGLMHLTEEIEINGMSLGKVLVDGRYFFNPQLEWTGGGILATAGDLARWASALFQGGLIKDRFLAEMLATTGRWSGRYGLGVQVRHSGFWGLTYGHSGWMPGYSVAMEYFPDSRTSIVVMLNIDHLEETHPRRVLFEVMKIIAD